MTKKAHYEVIRPWFGVQIGDVLELERVHPSLEAHLRPVTGELALAVELDEAAEVQVTKADIMAELKAQGIKFDQRKSAEELAELLPK